MLANEAGLKDLIHSISFKKVFCVCGTTSVVSQSIYRQLPLTQLFMAAPVSVSSEIMRRRLTDMIVCTNLVTLFSSAPYNVKINNNYIYEYHLKKINNKLE